MRHDCVNQRWRFRPRQQQHLAGLHFQNLIGGYELLPLLGGGGLAPLTELRSGLLRSGQHRLIAKRVRGPIGGFKFGAAETENAGGDT